MENSNSHINRGKKKKECGGIRIHCLMYLHCSSEFQSSTVILQMTVAVGELIYPLFSITMVVRGTWIFKILLYRRKVRNNRTMSASSPCIQNTPIKRAILFMTFQYPIKNAASKKWSAYKSASRYIFIDTLSAFIRIRICSLERVLPRNTLDSRLQLRFLLCSQFTIALRSKF